MATIRLESSDKVIFEVTKDVSRFSQTIAAALDVGSEEDTAIPLLQVNGATLRKFVEWVEHHKDDKPLEDCIETKEKGADDIPQWDKNFFKMELGLLLDLVEASNYLHSEQLFSMICTTVALMFKEKTPEQIRTHFSIVKVD